MRIHAFEVACREEAGPLRQTTMAKLKSRYCSGRRMLHHTHHKYNKEHTLSPFAGLAFNALDGILQVPPLPQSCVMVFSRTGPPGYDLCQVCNRSASYEICLSCRAMEMSTWLLQASHSRWPSGYDKNFDYSETMAAYGGQADGRAHFYKHIGCSGTKAATDRTTLIWS